MMIMDVGWRERNKPSFIRYDVPIRKRSKDSYLDIIHQ
jgi:hypothetical protein